MYYLSDLRANGQVCKLFALKGLRSKRRYGTMSRVASDTLTTGGL